MLRERNALRRRALLSDNTKNIRCEAKPSEEGLYYLAPKNQIYNIQTARALSKKALKQCTARITTPHITQCVSLVSIFKLLFQKDKQ